MTTALRAMTTDELRDWLAIYKGWTTKGGRWYHPRWHARGSGQKRHPIEPTIDAAAKPMPEGWDWGKGRQAKFGDGGYEWLWWAEHRTDLLAISAPVTGDEIHDRLLLACLCIESQGASR